MQEYINVDRYIPSINKKCSELSFAVESDHYSLGDTLQSIEDAKAEQNPFVLKEPFYDQNPHPYAEFSATACKTSKELKMALSSGNPNINIASLVGKYSIDATMNTEMESEKFGFSIVTKIQCLTKVLTLKEPSFSPEALQLIEKQDWETFYNKFGDYYASQIFRGSLLKLTINVASSSKNVDMNDFIGFSTTSKGKTPAFPASLKGFLHKLSEKYSLDYSLERIGGPSFEGTGPTPETLPKPTAVPDTPTLPDLPSNPTVPAHPHPGTPSTPATPTTPDSVSSATPSSTIPSPATPADPSTTTASPAAPAPTTRSAPAPSGSSTAPTVAPVHEPPKPHSNNNNISKPKPELKSGVIDKQKGKKDMENLLDYCTKFCENTNDSNDANITAVFTSYRIPGLTQTLFPMKKNYDDVCEEVFDYLTVQSALMMAKSKIAIPEKSLEADGFLLQVNEAIRAIKGIYDTISPWQCQPFSAVRDQLKADLKTRYKTPQEWFNTANQFLLDLKFNGLKHKSGLCLRYVGTNKDEKGDKLFLGPACPKDFEFWELDKQIQHRDDRWAPTVRYEDETNLIIELVHGNEKNEVQPIQDGSHVYIVGTEHCLGHHNYLSSHGVWDDDRVSQESKWTIHIAEEKKKNVDYGDVITIQTHDQKYLAPGKNIHGVHKVDLSGKPHYWAVYKPRQLPRDHSKV
mmetsp:Transcript_1838/g.2360  ORF Transcript_1838/g.2360 Transcript_1838/m.2360 type:complete len:688 (-) Transcript_1838:37-2100(-)